MQKTVSEVLKHRRLLFPHFGRRAKRRVIIAPRPPWLRYCDEVFLVEMFLVNIHDTLFNTQKL